MGTVKWFNATKGYGSSSRTVVAPMFLCTSRPFEKAGYTNLGAPRSATGYLQAALANRLLRTCASAEAS
jgi:hypothetical protein